MEQNEKQSMCIGALLFNPHFAVTEDNGKCSFVTSAYHLITVSQCKS